MCVDADSRPPIPAISGGALDHQHLTLTAADGSAVSAFAARAATPSGAGILIVPDVRGLHPFYEELALRFAEHGIHAVAIDPFCRSAGTGPRGASFEGMLHASRASAAGLAADIAAGVAHLRSVEGGAAGSLFSIGFCFGGRAALNGAAAGLGLAGVIGLYGWPVGSRWGTDIPAPTDLAPRMTAPVLGLWGGADAGIPAQDIAAFEDALRASGVEHLNVTYPGAPHGFFDRKAADFGDAAADAWERMLAFITAHTGAA